MSTPDVLTAEWRDLADQQRDLGAEAQAGTLDLRTEDRVHEPMDHPSKE